MNVVTRVRGRLTGGVWQGTVRCRPGVMARVLLPAVVV